MPDRFISLPRIRLSIVFVTKLILLLADRTDYAKNPEKTEKGELVTSYCCDPMTVDEEFMLQKRQYYQITGRSQNWKAYLLGIPTLFIYILVWMARIAEELKSKAIELGLEGPYTSWWHMFGWNAFGILLLGPAVATHRFSRTLNNIEAEQNRQR